MKKIILLLLTILLFVGCKKDYPDDKRWYLMSPKKRLTRRHWTFNKYEYLTPYVYPLGTGFYRERLNFLEDGRCQGAGPFPMPDEMIYLYNFNGTWELIENDSKIKVTYKINPAYSKIWTIQKLDKRALTIYCDSVKYELIKD